MGHVIQQNDHLLKLYHIQNIKLEKYFLLPWQPPKVLIYGDLVYFYGFLESHCRGSGAGAPNMDHVIHQNDHLVKPYHIQKIKLEKNMLVTKATTKMSI